mgnify:CR=1 FL=1
MTTFDDLRQNPHPNWAGWQAMVYFDNGYCASVIQSPHSYGGDKGLFEIGVGKGSDNNWSLCYDTPITSDVLGHLTEADVTRYLKEIEELPTYLLNV